jgi:hypothetical protein
MWAVKVKKSRNARIEWLIRSTAYRVMLCGAIDQRAVRHLQQLNCKAIRLRR